MPADSYPPFSKKSKGYLKMVELFDNGVITADMPPKVAYQTDPLFLKYKTDAFRAGLNKYKTEKGFHLQNPSTGKDDDKEGKSSGDCH